MAIKGLSIPVFGHYQYNQDTNAVTYTDGFIIPHAISYSLTMEAGDNNPFYADNRVVENDIGTFSSGTLSLETDDLTQEASKKILGAVEIERTYGDKTVTTLIYDDSQDAPTFGFGLIEEHQVSDVTMYKAIWLKKVVFGNPEDAATTRGETIEWQSRTVEASVIRSDEMGDNGNHPWKEEAWFSLESEALGFLKAMLGVVSA